MEQGCKYLGHFIKYSLMMVNLAVLFWSKINRTSITFSGIMTEELPENSLRRLIQPSKESWLQSSIKIASLVYFLVDHRPKRRATCFFVERNWLSKFLLQINSKKNTFINIKFSNLVFKYWIFLNTFLKSDELFGLNEDWLKWILINLHKCL